MTGPAKSEFKRWLTSRPRPHGAVIEDRIVSNLELFYDLVYVAVIGQAAQRLSEDISARSVAEFAVVFTMLWLAWLNGSLYIELHGREDGRTRLLVFAQMCLLALLAVFTGTAATRGGAAFALAYAMLLALMTWQWWLVRQIDRTERPEFMTVTAWYVGGMAVSTVGVAASALVPDDLRIAIWVVVAVAWVISFPLASRQRGGLRQGIMPTESLVERFGLFTIIVLGEVVIGVVDGVSAVEADPLTMLTGFLSLVIGFGFWWLYFDLVGRRLPRDGRWVIAAWITSHLPIALAITASGAAIASLVAHAHDPATPAPTAWLLAGSVALGLVSLIAVERSLVDAVRLSSVYRPAQRCARDRGRRGRRAAWLDPAPWLLALGLVAILALVWFFAVAWLIRAGAWGESGAGEAS